jgi:hypothetical protein
MLDPEDHEKLTALSHAMKKPASEVMRSLIRLAVVTPRKGAS